MAGGVASDEVVSDNAMKLWDRLDGTDGWGDLIRNKNVVRVDTANGPGLKSTDGMPVIMTEAPEAFTEALLASKPKMRIKADGTRETTEDEFARFLRRPGSTEMSAVLAETADNPFLLQEVRERVLRDYEMNVNQGGKFDQGAFEEWREETLPVVEKLFGPKDMLMVRTKRGGLRAVVEKSGRDIEVKREALEKVMKIDDSKPLFRDPSSRAMWNQLKSLNGGQRTRAMRILDSMDMGDPIRALLKEDLRLDLIQKTQGAAAPSFNKWLKDNKDIIEQVLGDNITPYELMGRNGSKPTSQYMRDLQLMGNVLERRNTTRMVVGQASDANPTGLAMFRVIFGPLSRIQRFLTGARRGLVRLDSAKAADLITDPQKLRALAKYQNAPVQSVQFARVVQDLGIDEVLGLQEFDAESAESRQQLAERVMILLQEEMDETVGQEE